MSAELLREAASAMRSRAEAATPGPWSDNTPPRSRRGRHVGVRPDLISPGAIAGDSLFVVTGPTSAPGTTADAEHIAAWHPAVALAVADWLDIAAEMHEHRMAYWSDDDEAAKKKRAAINHLSRHALAVANAYLGRDA